MNCQCVFCQPEVLAGDTNIMTFDRWVLLMNRQQFLIGTCLLVSKTHREGITSLSPDELVEVYGLMKQVEQAIGAVLSPDWFNFLHTNNSVRHLHVHIIPRYKNPKSYYGELFVDQHYHGMPVEESRVLPAHVMQQLAQELRAALVGGCPSD